MSLPDEGTSEILIAYKHREYTLLFWHDMATLSDILLDGNSVIKDFSNSEIEWFDTRYNPYI